MGTTHALLEDIAIESACGTVPVEMLKNWQVFVDAKGRVVMLTGSGGLGSNTGAVAAARGPLFCGASGRQVSGIPPAVGKVAVITHVGLNRVWPKGADD